MRHIVLCRLAALLAAAWTMAAPIRSVAASEGPGSPGETTTTTTTPASTRPPPAVASGAKDPASNRPKRETYPFRGTIAAVDAPAMTLLLEGKQSKRTIHLLPETRIEKDGTPLAVDAVQPGEAVGGTLRRSAEGREEAVLVRIGPKPENPPPGTGPKPKRKSKSASSG